MPSPHKERPVPGQVEDGGRYRLCFGEVACRPALLPEVRMLGWARFPRAACSLPEHRHEGAFEVCYIADGSVDWWVEGEQFTVPRGHLYVTLPGERHGGAHAVMNPCELFWLQMAPPLPGLPEEGADALLAGLRSVTVRSYPASPATASLFAALFEEHRRAGSEARLAAVAARGLLHALLAGVVRDHAAVVPPAAPPGVLSPAVAVALSWMEARLCQPFTVGQAAAAAGISPTTLHERFLREAGETPADWRARRRIDEAKRRLVAAPAGSVTEVAYALGFGSSQYFATAFRRYTGLTPTEYRRAVQSGATSSPPASPP
jgi:AraC-like DNA-binding protein/mannose-6-phosphate isomerase-like protein (cupin superfamily)